METKNLSESTICCFGDSTTWGDNGCGAGGNDISWTSHLGALLGGAVVENFGIKGSRIAIKADRSDSFVERLDGIDDAAMSMLSLAALTTLAATCRLASWAAPMCMSSMVRSTI